MVQFLKKIENVKEKLIVREGCTDRLTDTQADGHRDMQAQIPTQTHRHTHTHTYTHTQRQAAGQTSWLVCRQIGYMEGLSNMNFVHSVMWSKVYYQNNVKKHSKYFAAISNFLDTHLISTPRYLLTPPPPPLV